jgi:catechol 2,3-dioxygenase-like lactoylglutathione lyase family enzyme
MLSVMTTLDHVALACRDPDRTLGFYRDMIGVEGSARKTEYGYVVSTPTGIQFTLFRGEPPASMGEFHIGVSLVDAGAVRQARARFASLGVTEHDWWDEPDYVSVKVLDPDGYIVEVSWEPEGT